MRWRCSKRNDPFFSPRILLVQFLNERRTQLDQRILFAGAVIGIGQIGKQSEVNVGIVIAEVTNFKILDQSVDLLFVEKERGNGDESHAIRRKSFRVVELGQDLGGQKTSVMMVSMIWIAHCEPGTGRAAWRTE